MRSFLASASAPDWISAGIATLALLLSVCGLYLRWRDKQPRLVVHQPRVEQRFRTLSYDAATDQSHGEHQNAAVVRIANTGDRPITLTTSFLRPLLGSNSELGLGRDYGPDAIMPDTVREFHTYIDEALRSISWSSRSLGLFRLEVRDHMDRRWHSPYFRFTRAAI